MLRAERVHHFEQAARSTAALLDLEAALRKLDPVDPAIEAMLATPDGPAPAGVAVYVDPPEQHGPAAAVWARAVIERIESLAQPDDPGSGTSHEILQAVLRESPVGGELERWLCERLGESREGALAAIASRREHDPEACDADDAAAAVLLYGVESTAGKALVSIVSCIDCQAVVAWILASEQARAELRPRRVVREIVTSACEQRLASLREASR
jgi:hypothetical protein